MSSETSPAGRTGELQRSGSRPPPPPPDERGVPSGRRWRLSAAFVVAAVSDILSLWLEFVPPIQWGVDLVTGLLLFLILGRQWALLPALVAEAIPGLGIFPIWILVVAAIAVWGKIRPLRRRPR